MQYFGKLFLRYLIYFVQAVIAVVIFSIFRVLPIKVSSAIGSWVGKILGPRIAISCRARRNLSRIYPKKSKVVIEEIILGMWDNLGRLAGEFPHLSRLNIYKPNGFVEVVGGDIIDQLRDDKKPGIFFSAHLGNWELIPLCGIQKGLSINRVYRAANNPLVKWLYNYGRASTSGVLIPKGPQGVKLLLDSLKKGKHLGVLMDQKMNDGIPVPFFGIEAMTASAIAELALRFDCPMVPVHIKRLGGVKFRIIFEAPLVLERTGNHVDDVQSLMIQVNNKIEGWIKAVPEQWLWLHNRWPD